MPVPQLSKCCAYHCVFLAVALLTIIESRNFVPILFCAIKVIYITRPVRPLMGLGWDGKAELNVITVFKQQTRKRYFDQ